ncbi:MAG: mechanosensitive ion channel family protein [Phycisphaeraceae bacterium]
MPIFAAADPPAWLTALPDWLRALPASPVVSTVILIAAILIARGLLGRLIKQRVTATDLRRRWLVQTRNALLLVLLLGLVVIWATELQTLALSLVAIVVAFVIATKELILCLSGSVLKTGAGSFNVGDRIQVKDFRGDVIDQNLLATTIMEVGPGKLTHQRTGRVTVIPNSVFLAEPVTNESYTHDYVLHVFTIPFKRDDDWQAAREAFLASAMRRCQPYLEDVRRHMQRLSDRQGLDTPSVDPRVTIQIPAAGEVHLVVRLPVRARERSYIEQAILAECFASTDYAKPPTSPSCS